MLGCCPINPDRTSPGRALQPGMKPWDLPNPGTNPGRAPHTWNEMLGYCPLNPNRTNPGGALQPGMKCWGVGPLQPPRRSPGVSRERKADPFPPGHFSHSNSDIQLNPYPGWGSWIHVLTLSVIYENCRQLRAVSGGVLA